jgi:outer membrane lipoprotein SlyB
LVNLIYNTMDSTLQGILGGAGTGAAMGTAIGGPIGAGIGALLGGVVGGIFGNNKSKAQAESLAALNAIPAVDPNQTIFKDQLYREKKAVESGFTTDFQVARDIIGKSEAGGMSVAAEMAQTNPALALMAMNQIGQGTDTAVNKALGTIGTKGFGYTQMISELIDKMSSRKLSVGIMKASQGMVTATQGMQDFNANANAGMMKLMDPSVIGGFKGLFATLGIKTPYVSPGSEFANLG